MNSAQASQAVDQHSDSGSAYSSSKDEQNPTEPALPGFKRKRRNAMSTPAILQRPSLLFNRGQLTRHTEAHGDFPTPSFQVSRPQPSAQVDTIRTKVSKGTQTEPFLHIAMTQNSEAGECLYVIAAHKTQLAPEQHLPVLRKVPSDAGLQQFRTSANCTHAVIPSNHAKTPDNFRYDFYEDSMAQSVIQEFALHNLDWTRPLDRDVLQHLITKMMTCYILATSPLLSQDDSNLVLARTVELWQEGQYDMGSAASPPLSSSIIRPTTANEYGKTLKYLYTLEITRQRRSRPIESSQTLFPASIVRYIESKGQAGEEYRIALMKFLADNCRLHNCKYDVRKVVQDYHTLSRGPWGR